MPAHRLLRDTALLVMTITYFAALPANAARADRVPEEDKFDLAALQASRDPETALAGLDEDMRKEAEDRFNALVMEDSNLAIQRNESGLYPNPSIQAYVNRLGQSLIPPDTSDKRIVTFKVLEDPYPYADAQATGTIYLSTGLVSLLDNESQLAFVLMHEAAHVVLAHQLHQIIENQKAQRKAKKIALISTAAGAVLGAIGGGKGKELATAGLGAALGHVAGGITGGLYTAHKGRRFLREVQFESDRFAIEVVLNHGFDAREAPTLMAKVGSIVQRSGAAADMAFGNSKDLPPRSAKVSDLLSGFYRPLVGRVLSGEGFRMSSPRYSQLMAELKRDNGLLALKRDLFAIARSNLEEAAAVRTDDPITMYGLGMLYRAIGRTNQDQAKATGYLKSAMEFDEVRHRFPQAYLEYAVELLSREDPRYYPEIQKALKSFVVLYQRQSGGSLPREMRYVYDYLDLTGDRSWIAYPVGNISSEPPYQLSGDAKIDDDAQVAVQPKVPVQPPVPAKAKAKGKK